MVAICGVVVTCGWGRGVYFESPAQDGGDELMEALDAFVLFVSLSWIA